MLVLVLLEPFLFEECFFVCLVHDLSTEVLQKGRNGFREGVACRLQVAQRVAGLLKNVVYLLVVVQGRHNLFSSRQVSILNSGNFAREQVMLNQCNLRLKAQSSARNVFEFPTDSFAYCFQFLWHKHLGVHEK